MCLANTGLGFKTRARLIHRRLDEVASMTDEIFTDPEETSGEWVDVRMTNPEEGEWDVDLVVVDGRVSYVDLRIRPELLEGFLECLIDDISEDRGRRLLTEMAERKTIELPGKREDE